jgi:hypothetical protein
MIEPLSVKFCRMQAFVLPLMILGVVFGAALLVGLLVRL